MKKHYLWTVLAGMVFAGCVSDESSPVEETKKMLTFDAPVFKTQTRAAILGEITGKKYPVEESFNVFAYSYTGNFEGSSTVLTSYFNVSGEVATNASTGTTVSNYWQTSAVHYWPDAAHNLAFVAYSPAVAPLIGTVSHDAGAGLQITGFQVQSTSDEQYDLMYSNRVYDRNINNNGNAAVPLVFNHALSSIVFSATRDESSPETTITDLCVKGTFATKGNFSQGISGAITAGVYSETNNAAWTSLYTSPVDYDPTFTAFDVPVDVPTQFTKGTSAILTIPQNVPADAVVSLTYETKTGSGTLTTTKEIKLSDFIVTSTSQPVTVWEMGKRYVYRFSFGATSRIYFEPEIVDWKQHETAIVTINPGA